MKENLASFDDVETGCLARDAGHYPRRADVAAGIRYAKKVVTENVEMMEQYVGRAKTLTVGERLALRALLTAHNALQTIDV